METATNFEGAAAKDFGDRAELLQTTLNCMPSGVVFVSADGLIVTCNSRFIELISVAGMLESRYLSRSPEKLTSEPLLKVAPRLADRPHEIVGSSGRVLEFVYIENQDQLRGTLILINDITSQHINRAALKDALEQRDLIEQARTAFISQVAHHFRTPLHVILGYTDMLANDVEMGLDDASRKSYITFIRESAAALFLNMNEMMDMIRLQRKEQEVEPEGVPFAPLLDFVTTEIAPVLQEEVVDLDMAGIPEEARRHRVRVDVRLARRGLLGMLKTCAVLGGQGSTVGLSASVNQAGQLELRIGFKPGRAGVSAIILGIEEAEPVAEISLTGNAGGYGLALASVQLRLCGAEVTAAADGEDAILIRCSFPPE
jgi:signal transduction histidine kinase